MGKEVIYRASNSYILREIAGESVLVSVGNGVADFCGIIKLNPTAKTVWTSLKEGATKAELVHKLSEVYGAEEVQITEDVERTLNMLESRGMITFE